MHSMPWKILNQSLRAINVSSVESMMTSLHIGLNSFISIRQSKLEYWEMVIHASKQ